MEGGRRALLCACPCHKGLPVPPTTGLLAGAARAAVVAWGSAKTVLGELGAVQGLPPHDCLLSKLLLLLCGPSACAAIFATCPLPIANCRPRLGLRSTLPALDLSRGMLCAMRDIL